MQTYRSLERREELKQELKGKQKGIDEISANYKWVINSSGDYVLVRNKIEKYTTIKVTIKGTFTKTFTNKCDYISNINELSKNHDWIIHNYGNITVIISSEIAKIMIDESMKCSNKSTVISMAIPEYTKIVKEAYESGIYLRDNEKLLKFLNEMYKKDKEEDDKMEYLYKIQGLKCKEKDVGYTHMIVEINPSEVSIETREKFIDGGTFITMPKSEFNKIIKEMYERGEFAEMFEKELKILSEQGKRNKEENQMTDKDAEKIMKASGKVITDSATLMELAVLLADYMIKNKK